MHSNSWYPEQISNVKANIEGNYAIIVLNRKIRIPTDVVVKLWQNAKIRLTVDGGTDKWFSFVDNIYKKCDLKFPNLATGDFDSISSESLNRLNDCKECKKIITPDQNETDFTKSIRVLKSYADQDKITKIITFVETSGRLDHIMANINTLVKVPNIIDKVQIYLLSSNSLTWLLQPGEHSIFIPADLVEQKRWCALIPILGKTLVSTTGLKWNLEDSYLEFGGIVSSSNTFSSQTVSVCTNKALLWSMSIFNSDEREN